VATRPGRPAPEPEIVAKALHLRRTTDLSLKAIAAEIGVKSPSTVMNYLAMAEHAETWFPALDRREVSSRLNLIYAQVMDRLLARLDDPEAEPEKVAMAIRAIGQELAKMHGLYARIGVDVATDGPPVPDPETTAAIQTALAELHRRRAGGSDVDF
jgi:hypothetical protein